MPDSMIERAAEAFLTAIESQSSDRSAAPRVYRKPPDLSDVQIMGQVDVRSAMLAALRAIREPSEAMEIAGVPPAMSRDPLRTYQAMIDAALTEED
jgi:hypothetical protein